MFEVSEMFRDMVAEVGGLAAAMPREKPKRLKSRYSIWTPEVCGKYTIYRFVVNI